MAVNQPHIGSNQTDNAWKLEVTALINREEAKLNQLITQTGLLDTSITDVGDNAVVKAVDETGILRVSPTGTLSNDSLVNNLNLAQSDYSLTIPAPASNTADPSVTYQFSAVGTTIPETHMLFLAGFRLCESTTAVVRDYNITNGNVITLERTSRDLIGLDLILTVFSIT